MKKLWLDKGSSRQVSKLQTKQHQLQFFNTEEVIYLINQIQLLTQYRSAHIQLLYFNVISIISKTFILLYKKGQNIRKISLFQITAQRIAMDKGDIRFIQNPFQKIFNIIKPDQKKLYSLLMRLLQDFFNHVKIPTLSDYASDPNQTTNDISAYSGANGYLYMLIRLSRYFAKQQMRSFVQFSNSSHIKSDGDLNKFMDPQFYLERAIEQYKMIEKTVLKNKPSKHLSFYMSEVCTWVCGMHIGFDTRNYALFRQNQALMLQCYHTIRQKGKQMIWQLLYGVAGFLYAVLELQHEYDNTTEELFKTNFKQISIQLTKMVIDRGIWQYEQVQKTKVNISDNKLPEDFRLVFTFHKKQYLGGAHGLGGNLNIILMSMRMNNFSQADVNKFLKVIHPSIFFLLRHFINGNFSSSKGRQTVKLVHFCHGAPGIVNSLARYLEMFPENGIALGLSDVIQRALDHIWNYGVLKKGFGLCHGISGNAYSFLSQSVANVLPQRAEEYRKKAWLFALLREDQGVMKQINTFYFEDRFVVGKSDNPFSLMLGSAGDICFVMDAFVGVNRFPGFNFEI